MELLFISLAGAILGIGAYYLLPHRKIFGVVLVPAIGVATAATLWVALTWAGLSWNAGAIWWISLIGTAVIVTVADLVIASWRTRTDAALLAKLTKATAV
ncbi:MAG: hypothetical protein ABI255_04540 [Microbacteriaceae bacterium]